MNADATGRILITTKPFRILLGILLVLTALTAWVWPLLPTADTGSYFAFADQRIILGIPFAFDVLTNLGFFLTGIYGFRLIYLRRFFLPKQIVWIMSLLGLGCVLTSLGSSYFHLWPSPDRLFWDRLPMTLGFASAVALLVADRIDDRLGFQTMAILLPLGAFSVWGMGSGILDLRPYIFVQFGSLILMCLIGFLRKPNRLSNGNLAIGLGLYLLAKVFELLDERIFDLLGFVSGHSLKHIFAALAILKLMHFMKEDQTCHSQS